MKRLIAIVLVMVLLASCASENTDGENSFDGAESVPTESEEELEFPYNLEWSGEAARNSPYRIEDSARTGAEYEDWRLHKDRTYMQELGLEEDFLNYLSVYIFDDGRVQKSLDSTFLGCAYSGEYYRYSFCFHTVTYVAVNIDTNVEGPCSVEITITEINPETGEEKTVTSTKDNAEGECGAKYIAYADEGFYIKEMEYNFTHLGVYLRGGTHMYDDEAFENAVKAYLSGKYALWKDPNWDGVI